MGVDLRTLRIIAYSCKSSFRLRGFLALITAHQLSSARIRDGYITYRCQPTPHCTRVCTHVSIYESSNVVRIIAFLSHHQLEFLESGKYVSFTCTHTVAAIISFWEGKGGGRALETVKD